MTVTEQLDGLRALAIDPISYLVVPRVVAMMVMLFALTVLGDFVAIFGGAIMSTVLLGLEPQTFYYSLVDNLGWMDFVHGLIKSAFFGVSIALTSCYFGISVRGGAVGVGRAVNAGRGCRGRFDPSSRLRANRGDSVTQGQQAKRRAYNSVANLGGRAISGAQTTLSLTAILRQTIRGALFGQRPKGEVLKQMHVVGNRSLLFVAVTMGFVGMVMVYQSCLQLNRVTGDLSQVGREFVKLLVQDFGVTITSLMLATRVGAGIAAEIGSMKVTEQIDALRMSGVTPVDYLIVPRFLASLVMTVVLCIFGCSVAFLAGGLTAWLSFNVNPVVFFDISRVVYLDLAIGGAKAITCGIAIPVIAGFCGLRASGSSVGVGSATTSAVIYSSLAVIIIAFIISTVGLFLIRAGLG